MIERLMGPGTVVKGYAIPTSKDSKDVVSLIFAYPANVWFEKNEQEYLAKLEAAKDKELYRFEICDFEKRFKHHTHMVYTTRLNVPSDYQMADALLTQIERNWAHGRRIFLTDTVDAWLKGYKVHQEVTETLLGKTCVTMVVPDHFQLNDATHRELDYLRRIDSAETAERISKLMRKHGAVAVGFTRGCTPPNTLLLAEEVRNWAMSC